MPLYTKAWIIANLELYLEHSTPGDTCDICYQPFTLESPAKGPIQGEEPTRCRHFCCSDCWTEIFTHPDSSWLCPTCREDCTSWLVGEFTDFQSFHIPVDDIRELITTAVIELGDRPEFVRLAQRIMANLPPAM